MSSLVLFSGPLAEGLLLSGGRAGWRLLRRKRLLSTHLPPMMGGIQQLWDHQSILDFNAGAGELRSSFITAREKGLLLWSFDISPWDRQPGGT